MSEPEHSIPPVRDVSSYREVPVIAAISLPFVLLLGEGFAVMLYMLGYRQRSGWPALASVIAIVLGNILVRIFQQQIRKPSRNLKVAAALAWVIALTFASLAFARVIDLSDSVP